MFIGKQMLIVTFGFAVEFVDSCLAFKLDVEPNGSLAWLSYS